MYSTSRCDVVMADGGIRFSPISMRRLIWYAAYYINEYGIIYPKVLLLRQRFLLFCYVHKS